MNTMEGSFKIFGIVEPKDTKRKDLGSLYFRIELQSGEEGFMRYEMARKKYPHVVLDYFLTKLKKIQKKKEESIDERLNFSDDQQHREIVKSKIMINCCESCNPANVSGILDYDSIVPIETAIAYPVHFMFRKEMKQPKRQRRSKKHWKSQGLEL